MKSIIGFLASLFCIIFLAGAAFVLDSFKRLDLALPRTIVGDIAIGGMSRIKVREVLKEKLETFRNEKFPVTARGEVQPVTLKDLGIILNESLILSYIPFARDFSNGEIILWSFAGQRVMPKIKIERTELLRVIDEKFPNIPKVKNAHFVRKGRDLAINEGTSGLVPLTELFSNQLQKNIDFFELSPISIQLKESKPNVLAADLKVYRDALVSSMPTVIHFVYGKEKWKVDFEKHPEWIIFDWKSYAIAEDELHFSMQWDPLAFSQFLNELNIKKLEQPPEDVRIYRDTEGKIQFDGYGNEGRAIEQERLLTLINIAIANKIPEVEIPFRTLSPKIDVSSDLQLLGIRELIAVGHTRFAGSPPNRKHNIGIGVTHFSGVLIEPKTTFSFGDNLGLVDASTGYKKELVIKPEGTIPEFGGGLCQVSTTMYRAVMYAGLPIAERAPHSYAVTYYSQVGGHGLDATVYPPSRDLKFINDTPEYILIQSYVDGDSAYFKFYGTSDGRKVELEGPYISNKRNPPEEPLLVPDPKLAPGEKKQVEKPHTGFDVVWYRHITKNGDTKNEKIFSRYQAVPAKFLVGGQVSPEGENQGLIQTGANPFE